MAGVLATADIDAVFASDRRRSSKTAAPTTREAGVPVVVVPRDATDDFVEVLRTKYAEDRVYVSIHDAFVLPLLRAYGYREVVPSVLSQDLVILVPRPSVEPVLIGLQTD